MTTDKIQFAKEKETMLMTLNGRAIQSQWKNPILRDPWAEEAMRHIDYDIAKSYKGVGSWGMWNKIGCTIIATRAATFDLLTTQYRPIIRTLPCSTWVRHGQPCFPSRSACYCPVVRRGLSRCDRTAPPTVPRTGRLSPDRSAAG